jgi:hypothetical protein
VGAIVSVLGAARFSSSIRLWINLFATLLVVLTFPVLSPAQTTNTASLANQEVGEGQQPSAVPTKPVSAPPAEAVSQNTASPTAQSSATQVTQAPTVAEIADAASASLSAGPDTKLAPSAPPVQGTQPPAATNPASPVAAKYDVTQIGHRNVGSGLDFYSLDREIALGHQLSIEVEQSAKLVTDPIVTEYINRIGQNLVRNSDARVPFTIKVLDTDEVNAFALPGGFFYVNSGLILAADDEAELAGVMAHEIAHVAARHATKNMTRAQIWNMASVPLIFVGGPAAFIISEVASIAIPMTYLKFSRDAEREADLLGLEYDYAAGYDPHAFVEFFEKLNLEGTRKHSVLAKAFATHPMNADRIKAAQDEIRKYLPDRPEYLVNTSEFDSVKARLISLENGRRLGGARGGDGNRPVLLRRTSSSSSSSDGDSSGASSESTSTAQQKDDDRPTLKRNTPPDSN